jgi:hypothetical protein
VNTNGRGPARKENASFILKKFSREVYSGGKD